MTTDGTYVTRWRAAWPALLIVLLVFLCYWPGRGGGFVFDDYPNIGDNAALHVTTLDWPSWMAAAFSSPATALQRPLAMLSFALNHYFTGLDPLPMKLTNIGIHALNALLVLGLLRTLLAMVPAPAGDERRRAWATRFTAAAWALHPINLMAVLFVVQRMESLSHTFVFAGLGLYLLGRQRQLGGRHGAALIAVGLLGGMFLGVLAKESAVLLPLYAFCVEACLLHFRGNDGRPDRRLQVLYGVVLFVPALLAVAWLLPRVMAEGALAIRNFTLAERLLTEPRVVLDYLGWILLPNLNELSLYHDDYVISRGWLQPPSTLLAITAIAALLALALRCRLRRPLVSLGILWFLGAHLLTATFIPLELVYEHRNYFASLGICLVLADVLLLLPRSNGARRIGALLAAAAVLAFAGLTHLRALEWSNPYRFAASEAEKHPTSPRAAFERARIVVSLTDYQADSPWIAYAWRDLERARQVPGASILPHQAALTLAARTGTLSSRSTWWRDLRRLLADQPLGPENKNALIALTDCAASGKCVFPRHEMLATYATAIRAHGQDPILLSTKGKYTLHVLGNADVALPLWRAAASHGDADLHYNLVRLLIDMGRYDEAQSEIVRLRDAGKSGQRDAMVLDLQRRLAQATSGPP